jgi:hypothetical protein
MKNKTRINCKESFELCYLRHKYLRRAKHSPTIEEMKPYNKIVENFANKTYYVYKNLFILVGLDLEDVLNIAQVQLVSYLGSFALERDSIKMEAFKKTFRSHSSIRCTANDLLDKNKANFTCFLKQRLEDLVRVCKQKSRNIKGMSSDEFVVYMGTKRPPNDIEDLHETHQQYGYELVSQSAFKNIKKSFKDQVGPVYLLGEVLYICVPLKKRFLKLTDFTCQNYNPYDSLHNMTPEELYQIKEEESKSENNRIEFDSFSNEEKSRIVEMFMIENDKNPKFSEEMATAKRLLETLNATDV